MHHVYQIIVPSCYFTYYNHSTFSNSIGAHDTNPLVTQSPQLRHPVIFGHTHAH